MICSVPAACPGDRPMTRIQPNNPSQLSLLRVNNLIGVGVDFHRFLGRVSRVRWSGVDGTQGEHILSRVRLFVKIKPYFILLFYCVGVCIEYKVLGDLCCQLCSMSSVPSAYVVHQGS